MDVDPITPALPQMIAEEVKFEASETALRAACANRVAQVRRPTRARIRRT